MNSRVRIRPGGAGGQNQFTKRIKVAHPMERVLESIQQESADGDRLNERQERLKELLDQFERLPQHEKKGARVTDLLNRFEQQTDCFVDRQWCDKIMKQAFPILKEISRRSERQKEQLHDITVLMSSAAKMFLAELVETARCVQHEENLIRFGAFAHDGTNAHSALTIPSASGSCSASPDGLDESSTAVAAAAAGSGDAVDEPALFLRAVAANMQAGKKDIDVPLDAQHIREAYRRLIDGFGLGGAIPCISQAEYAYLNEFCQFGHSSHHAACGGAAEGDGDADDAAE